MVTFFSFSLPFRILLWMMMILMQNLPSTFYPLFAQLQCMLIVHSQNEKKISFLSQKLRPYAYTMRA